MKRRYVNNWIILDTEGWADRTQPLTATEGGWNPDTAECRIGPGMWEDLAPEPSTPGESTPTGIPFVFDTSTNDSGMSFGIRINHSFAQNATKMWIWASDSNSVSQAVLLELFTSGLITCYRQSNPGSLIYKVNRMEVKSGYYEFDVTYVSGSRPGSGEVLYAHMAPDAPGVRRYVATIDQTGTDAPIAIGEVNTTPFTPVYAHAGTGTFTLALTGLPLDPSKVKVSLVNSNSGAPNMVGAMYIEDGETIEMSSYNAAGSASNDILIRATLTVTVTP